MKVGAIVRCREWHHVPKIRENNPFDVQGVLIEYDNLSKVASVLVDGQVKSYRAHDIQLIKNP